MHGGHSLLMQPRIQVQGSSFSCVVYSKMADDHPPAPVVLPADVTEAPPPPAVAAEENPPGAAVVAPR